MSQSKEYQSVPFKTGKLAFDCIPVKGRNSDKLLEYQDCVRDLMKNETVLLMSNFMQHGNVTCLQHCILVSYKSYLLCRMLKLDYKSAARGALLHDLFLYDWHEKDDTRGLHAFSHPYTALRNANGAFVLNDREQDIIKKHMWPLTVVMPKFPESLIVSAVDKYCAVTEFLKS
jgi:uncharacterized protein